MIKLIVAMALLILMGGPLLAEKTSKILVFNIKPDEKRKVLFGAVVPKNKRKTKWKVQAVGLTFHSVNVAGQTCRMTLIGAGRKEPEEKILRLKELNSYELVRRHPPIDVWVTRVTEDFCEGRLRITSENADAWRVVSGVDKRSLPSGAFLGIVSSVKAPELVKQTRPRYTWDALKAGVEGSALLSLVILEDGSVDPESVHIARTMGYGLDEAAVEEVMNKWVFTPGSRGGKPVPVLVFVEITFSFKVY